MWVLVSSGNLVGDHLAFQVEGCEFDPREAYTSDYFTHVQIRFLPLGSTVKDQTCMSAKLNLYKISPQPAIRPSWWTMGAYKKTCLKLNFVLYFYVTIFVRFSL